MNKQYSDNQKNKIVEKYLSGLSVSDLSKQTGVARNTIYSWIKKSKSAQKALKRIKDRGTVPKDRGTVPRLKKQGWK